MRKRLAKKRWARTRSASPVRPVNGFAVPGAAPAIGRRPSVPHGLHLLLVYLGIHSRTMFFFVASLFAAYFFGWNNIDLVWGFLTTSFIVGNVAVMRGIASPFITLRKRATPEQWKELGQAGLSRKLGIAAIATFLLCWYLSFSAFMALHFTVFNLMQAWLVQGLFPHPGLTQLMEGPLAPDALAIARILLASYWFLVLQKLLFDRMEPKVEDADEEPDMGDWIKRPYLQVARMQLVIMAVFGLNALDSPQGVVYVTVFTIFFFPLQVFRRPQREEAGRPCRT